MPFVLCHPHRKPEQWSNDTDLTHLGTMQVGSLGEFLLLCYNLATTFDRTINIFGIFPISALNWNLENKIETRKIGKYVTKSEKTQRT